MKKKIALVVGVVLFVALIIGASVLYNTLKDDVDHEQLQSADDAEDTAKEDVSDEDDPSEQREANPAPDFTVTDVNGKEIKLSDYIGKPVVLNFWASWCGPCQMEMPDFEEVYKNYHDEIHFLMVNLTDGTQETVESATTFIKGKGYTFPVYYDTKQEAAYAYNVYSVPQTYFIDAEGNLEAWANGVVDEQTLKTGIDRILPIGE